MIEEDLYTALSTNTDIITMVGDRIFPLMAPQDDWDSEMVIYSVSNKFEPTQLDRAIGLGAPQQVRIQIDAYTKSYIKTKELSKYIIEAVQSLMPVDYSQVDFYDPSDKLYRNVNLFTFWE